MALPQKFDFVYCLSGKGVAKCLIFTLFYVRKHNKYLHSRRKEILTTPELQTYDHSKHYIMKPKKSVFKQKEVTDIERN